MLPSFYARGKEHRESATFRRAFAGAAAFPSATARGLQYRDAAEHFAGGFRLTPRRHASQPS